ncbi:MAG: ribose-phosphate diphosphokinase [Acidimicrobiia bacterium]|nr:ribose-phosphate diphosphokinase [Acidimicrobiia bacterium]
MELVAKRTLRLLSGRTHLPLAEEIAGCLDVELTDANLVDFADSEMRCRFGQSVRGADVFIVQTHAAGGGRSVNDSIMEQLIMIDAAKRASAKRITAVCPLFGYSRQDRKAEGREPITAKLVADMLRVAGAHRVLSVDLHSGQIQGFFDGPFDPLTAMPVLVDHLSANLPADMVIVAPDAGRVKVADRFAQHLHANLAIVHKRRPKGTVATVEAGDVVGAEFVEGHSCVLVDDMIATGSTIMAAAEQLKDHGATDIWVVATHGIFSGPAIDRLQKSPIDRVIVTNTVPLPAEKAIDKIEVLSVAGVIAAAINAVFEDTSVSEIFGGENQT